MDKTNTAQLHWFHLFLEADISREEDETGEREPINKSHLKFHLQLLLLLDCIAAPPFLFVEKREEAVASKLCSNKSKTIIILVSSAGILNYLGIQRFFIFTRSISCCCLSVKSCFLKFGEVRETLNCDRISVTDQRGSGTILALH